MEPQWIKWARDLQAISQIGLAYASRKPFDAERYRRVREIAAKNELPELSLSRVTPTQITRLVQRLRHPHWPTDLD